MWKKLLASSFVLVFVLVSGFAQASGSEVNGCGCECYEGRMYLYVQWANFEPFEEPTYKSFYDWGEGEESAFIMLCPANGTDTDTIHQLILEGEKSLFTVIDPCVIGSREKQICSIEEFEFDSDNRVYSVHGGNALVTKIREFFGKLTVRGKFIAGPDGEDTQNDTLLFYANANFTIVAKPIECPCDNSAQFAPVLTTTTILKVMYPE